MIGALIAAPVGGSVLSGLAGSKAAKTSADASLDAAEMEMDIARENNALQREMYYQNLEQNRPAWEAAIQNSAALNYALGTGPRPETLSYTYPTDTRAPEIRTISASNGSVGGNPLSGGNTGWMNGDGGGLAAIYGALSGQGPQQSGGSVGGGSDAYEVDGRRFSSMSEAQAYVDQNYGPSTFSPSQYQGYAPYTEFYGDLNRDYSTGATAANDTYTNALRGLDQSYDRGLKSLYNNFEASPDYEFRLNEGARGIDRSAASRGLALSGNTLKAQTDYASNLASGEWGNYINRGISNLNNEYARKTGTAGSVFDRTMGQIGTEFNNQSGQHVNYLNTLAGQAAQLPGATASISNLGSNYANNVGNALAGAARGAGSNIANAGATTASGISNWGNQINSGINNVMMAQMLQQGGFFG